MQNPEFRASDQFSGQAGEQFEAALRQSLARTPRFNDLWTDGSRYYTLTRLRNRVFYVAGTDRTAVQTALQAVK